MFAATPNAAAVTWNPPLQQARNVKGANMIFDSSKIPGEIIDMMVVRSNAPEALKKTLAETWFEVVAIMNGNDKQASDAIAWMAKSSGATVPEFKAQLATTALLAKKPEAKNFAESPKLKTTMENVRSFSFAKGLLGAKAKSKDYVGIAFPDGSVIGDAKNVKLRFTSEYMK